MKCIRPGKVCSSGIDRPEVAINTGVLFGKYRTTPGGSSFSSFTKIPFAAPPVGDLRFCLPKPARPWNGVLDAGKACPKPVQNNYVTGLLEGQEDCLYINVYRPEQPEGEEREELLPVMFWVYGGGFIMGDASEENYLPGPLLDTGQVIVVTANYRVGPLGFMSLEDDVLPGNLALWDQQMALRWVQENILQFGGDPNKVTVFANSAGSFCLYCLYVSPHCKGLFHRAIAQSGPLLSNSSPMQVMGKRPRLYGRAYAESLGCEKSDTSAQVVARLRGLPVGKLQSSFNIAGSWADMVPSPWKPLVDSWSSNPFMPKNPRDAIIDGEFNKVPVMSGITSDEGILCVSHIIREPERWPLLSLENWWKHLAEIAFHIHPEDATEADREMVVGLCQEYGLLSNDSDDPFLLEPESTKPQRREILQKLVVLFSDGYFKMGTLDTLQLISTHGVPAFQYRFSYDGEWKFADLLTMTASKLAVKFVVDSITGRVMHGSQAVPGVGHAEELHFLFSPTLWGMRNTLPSEKDREVSRRMVAHWVNFTKWGDPSIAGEPWTRVLPGQTDYMEIGERDRMRKFEPVEEERFTMWKGIFKERTNTEVQTTPLEIKLKPKPVVNIDASIYSNIKQNVPLVNGQWGLADTPT